MDEIAKIVPYPPSLPSMNDSLYDAFLNNFMAITSPPQDVALVSPQHGVCVPQRSAKRTGRDLLGNNNLVLFVRQDDSHIPVTAALAEDYTGLVNRDLPGLDMAGCTIAIRFEWPGYASKDFQLRTYDWRNPPKRISLSKLATEVGKIIRGAVEKMAVETIAPEFASWEVGPNGIKVEDLRLAALEQVSAGSWRPLLFYKP